jgi:hypothetical protein
MSTPLKSDAPKERAWVHPEIQLPLLTEVEPLESLCELAVTGLGSHLTADFLEVRRVLRKAGSLKRAVIVKSWSTTNHTMLAHTGLSISPPS